jgi:hypothetical protein
MRTFYASIRKGRLSVVMTDYENGEATKEIFSKDPRTIGAVDTGKELGKTLLEYGIETLMCSSSIDFPGEDGLPEDYPVSSILEIAWSEVRKAKQAERKPAEVNTKLDTGWAVPANPDPEGITAENHKRILHAYVTSIPAESMKAIILALANVGMAQLNAPLTGQLETQRDLVVAVGDAINSITEYDLARINNIVHRVV